MSASSPQPRDSSHRVGRIAIAGFTVSGTWTKKPNLLYVEVEVAGGNGSASWDPGVVVSPGGERGMSFKTIAAKDLRANEVVTVGGTAGTSSFGSHASATGGANAVVYTTIGSGGVGAGGDLNLTGQTCGGPHGDTSLGPASGQSGWVKVKEYYSA